jgi:hypothetical protein
MRCLSRCSRPWAAATARVSTQDMSRNLAWFNIPHMLSGPSNFFGPDGPADPTGLARDFRYQRHLTAIARLHPVRAAPSAGQRPSGLRLELTIGAAKIIERGRIRGRR